jgi:MFS family permease
VDQNVTYRGLLAVRGLPALILATIMSRLGGRMFSLTLILYVLARHASPALAGWLTFSAVAPGLAVSPIAGALLDRVGPTTGVGIDLVASTLLIAMVGLAGSVGRADPHVLFVLVALYSLTSPLGAAGIRSLLPRLVPPAALDRTNAIDTAIHAAVDVLGPGLAGLASGLLGPAFAMLLVAVSYASAGLCLSRVQRLPGLDRSRVSLARQTIAGIVTVARQPTLRGLALSYSLYQVTWGALVVIVPVLAADRFAVREGSLVAGFLWAAMGVASGTGALLAGHSRTTDRERRVMAAGMTVTALATWPIAAEFGFPGLALGLMLAGLVSGPIDVALLTLRQRRTDPRQLGRALSISMSLNLAGFPLGSAIAGALIATSMPAAFALAALASAIAAVATLSIPRDAGPLIHTRVPPTRAAVVSNRGGNAPPDA